MRYFYNCVFALVLLFPLQLSAQIITAAPADFTVDDEVTITYNASLGNKALMGNKGPVYIHTGVVSDVGGKDWKNTQGTWGVPEDRLKMQVLANDQYQIKFRPKDFYKLTPDDQPGALAFVFRNADGSLAGKNADDTDIYLPIQRREKEITNFEKRNYQSHQLQGNELVVTTDKGKIHIQAYADGLTRVSLSSATHKPNANSYSVVLKPQAVKAQVKEQPKYLLYDAPETDVYIQKSPLKLKFIQNGDTILAEEAGLYEDEATVGARFAIKQNEALYGSGSRAIPYNRRGKELKMNNEAHYGYTYGAPVLNITIPLLVSSKGYGVFFDNHYEGKIDAASKQPDVVDWRFKGGPASYYVIAAKDYSQLLNRYTTLTGKQPLPPMWSLGFIQSKYGYKDEPEARDIVKKLQDDRFPLDALVLDLYWFGIEGDMGRLDWDKTKWPNAKAMVKDFEKAGVNTIIITEPYFTRKSENFQDLIDKNLLVQNDKGQPYIIEDFWAGPAGLIDITKPEAQQWMWQFYKKQIDLGVQGWWSDLGEPENHPAGMRHQGGLKPYEVHNIYSLLWAKLLYEGYQREYPDQRPFNLIRSGYAGSQRYAIFPWSGDIERSWKGLQAQVPIMISSSMSGIGYMHSDLGGFTGGEKQQELYTRWLQMGAFVPIMRAHGAGGIPPEPVFYDEPYKSIVRDYINLRYSLTPYLYTMTWKNATEGMPLVLPMNFFDANNDKLKDINDQYFWGENMLVAPILEEGKTSRQVVLPTGTWVDFWTGAAHSGNQTVNVQAPLEQMPLFVRGGSFIPMTNARRSLSQYRTDTLSLQFYAAGAPANSTYTMYNDNGMSTKAAAHELLNLTASTSASGLKLQIDKQGAGFAESPKQRLLRWEVVGASQAPKQLSWNGQALTMVQSKAQLKPGTAWYDAQAKRLHAHVNYTGGKGTLEVGGMTATTPAQGQQTAAATTNTQGASMAVTATNVPSDLKLSANTTDATTGTTEVTFEVPRFGDYTLEVRDANGRTVALKPYYNISPGRYTYQFTSKDSRQKKLAAGTYMLVITGRDSKQTQELQLK